jgi:glycosyltransferase involved in cell wall biosynthesis
MKILLDIQVLQVPTAKRGMGRYSFELTQALLRNPREHEIILSFNRSIPSNAGEYLSVFRQIDPAVQIYGFEGVPSKWPVTKTESEAIALVQYAHVSALRPDVYHTHSFFEPEVWGGQTGDATVAVDSYRRSATLYDLIPELYPEQYLNNDITRGHYRRKFEGLKHCDSLLAISEASRRDAIARMPIDGDRVYNIGAAAYGDFKSMTVGAKEREELSRRYRIRKKFLLYTSGPDFRKNNVGLIEAFSKIPPPLRQHYHLVIVTDFFGTPLKEELLLRAQQCGLADDELILTGFVPDEDLLVLYNTCELFVFPSIYEGFGLPILEAMHCGAAVIVGNNSSQSEIVTNADARFDAADPKSICDCIVRALSDKGFRERLRLDAGRRVGDFSWDSVASKALDAWEDNFARQRKIPLVSCDQAIASLAHRKEVLDVCAPSTLVKAAQSRASLKRRLLVDVTYIAKIDRGSGVQRVVRNICRELLTAQSAVDVVLVTIGEFGMSPASELYRKWRIESTASEEIVAREGDTLLMLDSSWEYFAQFESVFQAIRARHGRIVTVVYDTIPLDHPDFCDQGFINVLTAWLSTAARVSDALVGISQDVANRTASHLQENGWASNTIPIGYFHLGAEITEGASANETAVSESSLAFRSNVPLFLVVSTIEPRKGQATVLDAFERVWSDGIDAQLCFVGKQGWHVEALCERIRSHPEHNRKLFWLSDLSDSDLIGCYRRSDVLLFPSVIEGFGLGLVEAAHFSTPVICSDIPVFREIARSGAKFVRHDDVSAWELAIRDAIDLKPLPDPSLIQVQSWRNSTEQLLDFIFNPRGRQHVTTVQATAAKLNNEPAGNMDIKKSALVAASALAACSATNVVTVSSVPIPTTCLQKTGLAPSAATHAALPDGEFVTVAYHAVLQRAPDPSGLAHFCTQLTDKKLSRLGVVETLLASPEAQALRTR